MSEYRVKPREAREARETIRKHDPALAMYLDVVMPLEKCKHDWHKGQAGYRNTLWDNRYICSGCDEYVVRIGTSSNYWITQDEWKARCQKLGQFFKGDMRINEDSLKAALDNKSGTPSVVRAEVYDGCGNWITNV